MNYLQYWSLLEQPFAHDASGRFFCGSSQREVIAGLNYWVSRDLPSAVLTSAPGCGATCLLRNLAKTSGFGDCAVEVILTDGNQGSLQSVLEDLAKSFRLVPRDTLTPDPKPGLQGILPEIKAAIDASTRQSVKVIWMIDNCSVPAARVACQLLASIPTLAALLVGHRSAASRVTQLLDELPHEAAPLEMELSPLSLDETFEYVRDSLHQAGGRAEMWSDSAIIRLYEFGDGRLGWMSLAAESAMRLAARHRMETVSPATVEAACERFARAA